MFILLYREQADDEDILQSADFSTHVVRFMKTMDHVVDTLDTDKEEAEQTMLLLGAKHGTFKGFKEDYFSVYAKCMIDTFEAELGEEFILEVRESWEALCAYMMRYMREGFSLYLHDNALEKIEEEKGI